MDRGPHVADEFSSNRRLGDVRVLACGQSAVALDETAFGLPRVLGDSLGYRGAPLAQRSRLGPMLQVVLDGLDEQPA